MTFIAASDTRVNKFQETEVHCKYCNAWTSMTGTRMCDNCWELEHRIRGTAPEIVNRILETVRNEDNSDNLRTAG